MLCQVDITTTVDGKKTRVSRQGTLTIADKHIQIVYQEPSAEVTVIVDDGKVMLKRVGDYSLCIHLEKGKVLNGSLGLEDNAGVITVKTERIAFFSSKNEVVLDLRYVLLIGEGQSTKVKIEAKGIAQ